jgi:hypothetical protein
LVDKSTREAQDAAVKTWNALKAECTSEKVVFEQRIKDKIIELETSAKKKTEWLDVEEIDLDRQEPEQQTLAAMPVIDNIQQWAANIPWEDA